MKLWLPPSAFAGQTMARRLADAQGNQAVRRDVRALSAQWDVRELLYLKRLAWQLFREAGVCEFEPPTNAIVKVGYFVDGKRTGGGAARRTVFPFRGATSEEIAQQVKLWREKRA